MRSLESIKGFGPVRLKALAARGIETALDLVETLPTGYKDTTRPLSPAQMTEGRQACFTGFVKGKPALHYARGMRWVSATIADECGAVRCMWFNQPWMKERLFDTCEVTLYGRCVRKKSGLFVINPSLEEPGSIIPVYAAVPGVGQKPLRDAVKLLLDEYDEPDPLPRTLVERCGLMDRLDALREVHFPTNFDRLAQAKERLAYEELLLFQAGVAGAAGERRRAQPLEIQDAWIEEFFDKLPFAPTNAQRRVAGEVAADMRGDRAMARMVQGDVGCGKTLIALCAMYLCVRAGGQAALMAPTEILASQHLQSAVQTLAPLASFAPRKGSDCRGRVAGGHRHARADFRRGGICEPAADDHRRTASLWRSPADDAGGQGRRAARDGDERDPDSAHAVAGALRRP